MEKFYKEALTALLAGLTTQNKDGGIKWENSGIDIVIYREDHLISVYYPKFKCKEWWYNNLIHRENGPAIKFDNGAEHWYLCGKRHQEGGPAVSKNNGIKQWWFDGKLHREDGLAVERSCGTKEWWINGSLHREDGPAVMCLSWGRLYYTHGVRRYG